MFCLIFFCCLCLDHKALSLDNIGCTILNVSQNNPKLLFLRIAVDKNEQNIIKKYREMRIYSILNSVIQEAIYKYFPGCMLLLDKLCKMF